MTRESRWRRYAEVVGESGGFRRDYAEQGTGRGMLRGTLTWVALASVALLLVPLTAADPTYSMAPIASSSCGIGEVAGNLDYDVEYNHTQTDDWIVINYCAHRVEYQIQLPVWVAAPNTTAPNVTVRLNGYLAASSDTVIPVRVHIAYEPGLPKIGWPGEILGLSTVTKCGGGICISPGVAKYIDISGFDPKAPQSVVSIAPGAVTSTSPVFSGAKEVVFNATPAGASARRFTAGLRVSPLATSTFNVTVDYSNAFGRGNGSLVVTLNSTTLVNRTLSRFQGSATWNRSLRLQPGIYTLWANLSLTNSEGGTTSSAMSQFSVEDNFTSIEWSYAFSDAVKAKYIQNATWAIISGGSTLATGDFGTSVGAFPWKTFPIAIGPGDSLVIYDRALLTTKIPGTFTLSISFQIDGFTTNSTATFATPS